MSTNSQQPTDSSSRIAAIIPARWASTRFPGKPLHPLAGKPMIQHVWERCQRCQQIDEVYVATDDERIFQAVRKFGAETFLTSSSHPSGTDRIAEVAARLPQITHILNVQGDEPTVEVRLLHRLAKTLRESHDIEMITAATPFPESANPNSPHMVKVAVNKSGNALYFSRSDIPFHQNGGASAQRLLHMGIYGFQKSFLLKFVSWRPSSLEKCEKLEQLRALENGTQIRVLVTRRASVGVDTPEDILLAEKSLEKMTRDRH